MNDFISKIIGELEGKREWKEMEARAKALPEDYQTVYGEVKQYIWKGNAGVIDPTSLFGQMVELFEEGAASGKSVLEVTGNDVAAFVDGLVRNEKTYEEDSREKLNQAIADKLGK